MEIKEKNKIKDFVENVKMIERMKTKYQLGTYMNKKENISYLTDNAGLSKGIVWGYRENGKYGVNNVPDINADTMM